jgi:hypothetical protein
LDGHVTTRANASAKRDPGTFACNIQITANYSHLTTIWKGLVFDDTSIIVSNPNLVEFTNNLISTCQQLNAWFNINVSLTNSVELSTAREAPTCAAI